MPAFQMPLDQSEYAVQWQRAKIGYFAKGYFEAMFFTECHSDNPELEDATTNDLSPEAWERSLRDCERFQNENAALLDEAMQSPSYDETDSGYGLAQAGRDYWFTRNGHGVGFWDRKELERDGLGEKLSAACRNDSVELYRGDDGKLYLS